MKRQGYQKWQWLCSEFPWGAEVGDVPPRMVVAAEFMGLWMAESKSRTATKGWR
jgi:hypothetical protein